MTDEAKARSPLSRLTGSLVPESVERAQHLTEETAQRLLRAFEQSQPVKRLRGSEIATAVLGAVGFALFFVGVEHAAQDVPFISDPYGSMAAGMLCLAVAGVLIRRLSGGE